MSLSLHTREMFNSSVNVKKKTEIQDLIGGDYSPKVKLVNTSLLCNQSVYLLMYLIGKDKAFSNAIRDTISFMGIS